MTKPIDQELLLQHIASLLGIAWDTETAVSAPDVDVEIVAPPKEEMAELFKLALAGNMREIRLKAEHIAKLGEQFKPFADKLDALARNYQSKAILDLVEEFMQP